MSTRADKGRFILHVIKQQRKNFLKPRRYPIRIWKIVRGDTVYIRHGEDRGKTGVVREVDRKRNTLLVDGVNFVKKAVKGSDTTKSGVFLMEAPLQVASCMLIDPTDGKPCRVGFRFLEDGTKVRVSKRTGAVIPKPDVLKQRKRPKSEFNPEKDTPAEAVLKQTYVPPSFLRLAQTASAESTVAASSLALLLLSVPTGFM